MKYDFETIYDRRGRDCKAIDAFEGIEEIEHFIDHEAFDFIPMWIAEMSFATAPSITDAIKKRMEHPLFGYFLPSDEYHNAIINWHKKRKNVYDIKVEHIGYENGVIGGVISALTALAAPGDPVLLHSPTYSGFVKYIGNNGYNIITSPLYVDDDGIWRMDYADMDKKIKENNIHVAIMCSPHNPCGRVWEREELEKAMEVYKNNDVYVISDEVWSDLILSDYKHIPLQSISEDAKNRTIAFYAPSKTFNIASIIGSYHIIYNKYLKDIVTSKGKKTTYNEMNILSMYALIGAYTQEGEEWLAQLLDVINNNIDYAYNYINEHLDGVSACKPQGTYLMFIDCSKYCEKHNVSQQAILHRGWKYGIAWHDGNKFNAPTSMRINLAMPLEVIKIAFDIMKNKIFI